MFEVGLRVRVVMGTEQGVRYDCSNGPSLCLLSLTKQRDRFSSRRPMDGWLLGRVRCRGLLNTMGKLKITSRVQESRGSSTEHPCGFNLGSSPQSSRDGGNEGMAVTGVAIQTKKKKNPQLTTDMGHQFDCSGS